MAAYFCVHCNFYQPPRGDPIAIDSHGAEPGAQPYRNFTEKAAAVCYTPNAQMGNLELISFNFNPALLRWMQREAPDTYQAVLAADRHHADKWGTGNAIASPQHHTVLPLDALRDKHTQVAWGLASFAHRFGRPAEGMWLPEMAVDLETLDVLAYHGLKFTILSGAQVTNAGAGGGPYRVNLAGGREMAVYVRDNDLSNQVAFSLPSLGGAGRWARNTLSPRKKGGRRLTLLGLDGETFGYHHQGEEHFLHWLLTFEAHAAGFEITTLARDLREHPPDAATEIREFTAWNCPHGGLRRWTTGCECTQGDARWKGALRRALDNLAGEVDEAFIAACAGAGIDPWPLRDDYLRVVLGQVDGATYLNEHGLGHLREPQTARLLDLLEAGFFRQRMYFSPAFFHEDLARPEPRFAIANGAQAAQLVHRATAQDLLAAYRRDLELALSADGRTGAQLLDEFLAQPAAH